MGLPSDPVVSSRIAHLSSPQFDTRGKSEVVNFPIESNNNIVSKNDFPIYPEDTLSSLTIDLTGPLPVVSILKRNNENREEEANQENKFQTFIKEAPQIPVRTALQIPTEIEEDTFSEKFEDISDINPELLKEGKKFIARNFFAVIFAHLVAIAFLLGVKPIQALLLRTGSIHNSQNTLKRYLSLIWTIRNIYECDLLKEVVEAPVNGNSQQDLKKKYVYNSESKTGKELKILRRAEGKIVKNFKIFVPPPVHTMKLDEEEQVLLEALKKDLSFLKEGKNSEEGDSRNLEKIFTTVNPDFPLSQYDLAIVQFTFFGFISLFPKVFGIHESDKKHPQGMEGFIHLWSVLAKRLGLEDRFNLCLNYNSEINVKIFRHIFLFSFKLADENLLKLWRTMTAGSSRYFFFFRTKSLIHFMLKNVAQVENASEVFEMMNCFEKFCYHSYNFCVKWLLKFFVIRAMINFSARAVFFLGYKFYLRRVKKENYVFDSDMIIKTVY